jgi:peptide/nickel transport system ATP-binding protein
MPSEPDLLRLADLAIEFRIHDSHVRAVDGASFRIRPGSTVALVGESGSGKSVISQAIMGILPRNGRIAGGEILFADPVATKGGPPIDIARLDPAGDNMRALRGGRISLIFQEPMTSLSPLHTIGDQIGEALALHGSSDPKEIEDRVEDILARVGFPDPQRAVRTYPFELSGGLRQRAVIAMALICRPSLVIADEPTTALDVTIQAQILKLLQDLQRSFGMAVLLITHDLGVVANMAEEIVVLYRGRIMESGTRDDIFRRPEHPYLKALLRAVPRFNMKPGERLTPLREIVPGTGHLLEDKPAWPDGADAAGPLLSIQRVTKSYTTRKGSYFSRGATHRVLAVDDVSFELKRGECLGLVGESGCGKTTVSKIVLRALTPDSGKVVFNDRGRLRDVHAMGESELFDFRRRIQFIFQDPYSSLNPRMTVADIIAEPLIIHEVGDAAYRAAVVRELLELVGLDPRWAIRYPHSFSGGQRQRIGIARALALKPDILLCDEPVSALDVSIQAQVLNLLKDLKARLGLTFLFVSHNLAVVDYIADRIAVMCRGRLVELAPRELLFRRPIHPYTRALLAAVPDVDPDRGLDLKALMEGRASRPEAWPLPFRLDGKTSAELVDIGEGHQVRARLGADVDSIVNWEVAA